jgi:hypothetical protein
MFSLPPKPQARGPPLVGCQRLLIQYIRSYPPYLEIVSWVQVMPRWQVTHIKGKDKVVPVLLTEHHAMTVYWGNGGIDPSILDLGTRWRWVISFTPRPLYPQGKSPRYTLDRRLGGLQSRSGHGGEEKNFQPPPGIEPFLSLIWHYVVETVLLNILRINLWDILLEIISCFLPPSVAIDLCILMWFQGPTMQRHHLQVTCVSAQQRATRYVIQCKLSFICTKKIQIYKATTGKGQ